MPHRSRRRRWALVLIALAATPASSAGARPADHPVSEEETWYDGRADPLEDCHSRSHHNGDGGDERSDDDRGPGSDNAGGRADDRGDDRGDAGGDDEPLQPEAPADEDRTGVEHGDRVESNLPRAPWVFTGGRSSVIPQDHPDADTGPLGLAALVGLIAGAGLAAAASVLVDRLGRRHPRP